MKRPFFCGIIAIMLILCTTPLLHAGAGRTAAQFLSLGGGTRPAALGDAFSAIKGDVNAAFWNPSGLMGIEKPEATLGYTDYSKLFGEAGEGPERSTSEGDDHGGISYNNLTSKSVKMVDMLWPKPLAPTNCG